jgi:hypothetical protein
VEKVYDLRHRTCSPNCALLVRASASTGGTTLIISDTQYPFAHRDHLPFLQALKEKYKPTSVVHIGDEMDFHALSDYDHDPDGDSPSREYERGMEDMYRLYKLFPSAKACVSNHTARPFRRAYKCGIPTAFLRSYAEFLKAPPGWEWADRWVIDNVLYEHGEGCSGKFAHLKAAEQNMQSTVMGHLHTNAGVAYSANPRCLVFGMAVGCLIDTRAYAFRYGKAIKQKPILGSGIVQEGIPAFIPMILRADHRWTGKL